ncbi:AT-rich interactive domain-containing protein 1A-like isoform X3 [Limulus polyphemus]|uniref:AT-rich interactive domain-containing protein 1A-like isoform X3 n=1 Tax=Limulus polyphemus TaxID=6850 RepID=A0ABM1SYD0_LIMPO|nr:AT-rich interactive domain-containing protein 1A-like isoform X3 [Limulus polyphemus]
MAAPAQALVNRTEQKRGGINRSGNRAVTNGASLEELRHSKEIAGNLIMNNRIKSPNGNGENQNRGMTMENFQDGGKPRQASGSSNIEQTLFNSSLERSQVNLEFQGYIQNSSDFVLSNDEYRNVQDNVNHVAVGSFVGSCVDRNSSTSNYAQHKQHGGAGISESSGDINPQPNKLFQQINQQQSRIGFSHSSRLMNMSPTHSSGPVSSASAMGSYSSNASQQQHRFRSASSQSIIQQGGTTPTLNQLLQAPNFMQHYQNRYEDFDSIQTGPKGVGEIENISETQYTGPGNSNNSQASHLVWSSTRSMSPYQQMSNTLYINRNQGGSISEPSMKRAYLSPGQQNPLRSPTQSQYGQQFAQRSFSSTQGQPQSFSSRTVSQVYPQQQTGSQLSAQNSQIGRYDQCTSQMSSYVQPGSQSPQDTANVPSDSGGGQTTPILRAPSTPPNSLGQQGQPIHQGVSPHRPAPSPSGSSTGSRSMSPAVGNQQSLSMPPRPSSGQSDGGGTCNQMTLQTMNSQGISQQMATPTIYMNKMHPSMMGSGNTLSAYHQQGGNYPRSPNSIGMAGYGGSGQNSYPQGGSGHPSALNMGRLANHAQVPQNYGAQHGGGYVNSQYNSGYGVNNMMPPPNQYPKGSPVMGPQAAVMAAASSINARSPPVHQRQHVQQKNYGNIGYNNIQSPQQQTHQGIPSSMALPATNASMDIQASIHQMALPPTSENCSPSSVSGSNIPPNQEMSSVSHQATSNLASQHHSRNRSSPMSPTNALMNGTDRSSPGGISGFHQTSLSSGAVIPTERMQHQVPPFMTSQESRKLQFVANPSPALDEGSQASNASGSSSLPEEAGETFKPNHKISMSHPPTPNPLPSPNATSMSSFHDDLEGASSPGWPRTPASPTVNSHGYEHHTIKRPDGLLKLYDLSDDPERHTFLDKLIMFGEERGTPLNQCPTISKQPLDLYRLYLCVKENGGFVDVTKSKHWKDIAGSVGIGASSSAAYTLRKQYIKHLLPFECKFDRGGVDPQPIIQQVLMASRKKNKNPPPASNAQEPFLHPISNNQPMDGYVQGNYPGPYSHPGQGSNTEFHVVEGQHCGYPQGPPPSNHIQEGNMLGPPPGGMPGMHYQRQPMPNSYGYNQPPVGQPYGGGSVNFSSGQTADQFQEQYGSQSAMMPPSEGTYRHRNMMQENLSLPNSFPPNRAAASQYSYQVPYDRERYEQHQMPAGPRPATQPDGMMGPGQSDPNLYPSQRYHNQQMLSHSRDSTGVQPGSIYQGRAPIGPVSAQTAFPPSGPTQVSGQGQYVQGQQPLDSHCNYQNYQQNQQSMYIQGGSSPNKMGHQQDMYGKQTNEYMRPPTNQSDQYQVGSYDQTQGHYGDRNQYYRRPQSMVPSNLGTTSQSWPRDGNYQQYPSSSQAQYLPTRREGWEGPQGVSGSQTGSTPWRMSAYSTAAGYSSMNMPNKVQYGQDRMCFPSKKIPPYSGMNQANHYPYPTLKKEMIFPCHTVEGVLPVLTKRRRLTAKDVSPVDPWRIMMSLKSGLLVESTWALDVLSVLICDDNSMLYFGLNHLHGLLEVLLEHYRRCLSLIFGLGNELEVGYEGSVCTSSETETKNCTFEHLKVGSEENDCLYKENEDDNTKDKLSVLKSENYTEKTRCGKIVGSKQDDALFLIDSDKKWDFHEGFESGVDHWKCGGGDTTHHIQTHLESMESYVSFVKIMEDKNSTALKEENEQSFSGKRVCVQQNIDHETMSTEHCEKEPVLKDNFKLCGLKGAPFTINKNSEQCCDLDQNDVNSNCEYKEKEVIVKEEKQDFKAKAKEDMENKDDKSNITEEQGLKIRCSSLPRKRHPDDCDLEKETYDRDEPSLCLVRDGQENLSRRCLCLSTFIRNLSFVPGNDSEMSKHAGFLLIIGKLLLLHHIHLTRKPSQQHYDREDEIDNFSTTDSCSSLNGEREWWWDMLHLLRENTLVTLANIAGQLDLAPFPEEISLPILNGLLHWAICPSSYAQDPFPTQPVYSVLSPQRLSLEALCKLSIHDNNVDLLLATPPWSRIEKLFSFLAQSLNRNKDQVLREFSLVILSSFAQADDSIAKAIALQSCCISNLLIFVEQAEQSALQVANIQGVNALRENPELMGTTLEKVRRAAFTLRCLSHVPENQRLFVQHQQRLLNLVMSQILDQGVASIIADVLYECSQNCETSSDTNSVGSTVL